VSAAARPRLAVFKLASCDGCQLQLLQSAEALAALAGAVDLVHFPEAIGEGEGPYDIALVEGSVSTTRNIDEVRRIRELSGLVVTIGACATAGGVQALRNAASGTGGSPVYAGSAFVQSLATSTPVTEHIKVDLELHGCPVDAGQLLGALAALLAGGVPRVPGGPVCQECKRRGFPCVTVVMGEPCLGPVTRTGCGAVCPGAGRGCYGCFGPADTTNAGALSALLAELGLRRTEVADRFRMMTSASPAFEEAVEEVMT
jgi:coenzyme F420-reducing hydrogenase gamma subunit